MSGPEQGVSPEVARRADFFANLYLTDLCGDIPPEILQILHPGDDFYTIVSGKIEPLQIAARRTTVADIVNWDGAYFGAIENGIITKSTPYKEFKDADVVTVYSELHGSVMFGYMTETGKRFLPRGDVSHLNSLKGDRNAALLKIANSSRAD